LKLWKPSTVDFKGLTFDQNCSDLQEQPRQISDLMRTTKLPTSTISNNPTLTVLTILSAKNSRGWLSSSIRKVRGSKRSLPLYQNFQKSQSSSREFDFLRYRLTISQTTTVIPSFSTAISLSRPSFLHAQVHLTQVFSKCAYKLLN
jgi:hypothetical protein